MTISISGRNRKGIEKGIEEGIEEGIETDFIDEGIEKRRRRGTDEKE